MTQQPDDRQPDEPQGPPGTGSDPKIDEEALWAEIVANYGDRPEMGSPRADVEPLPRPASSPRGLFDRTFIESTTQRSRELEDSDEGHYVPPEPPPLPVVEPRRRLAWLGLFGAPTLMLIGIVLGWAFPSWVTAGLVAAFVGGFVYLVATMPRNRPGDWSGDDGAVV